MAATPAQRSYELPPPGIKAVVWDWDKTVLRIHSWGQRIRPEDVTAGHRDGDYADGACFQTLVRNLVAGGYQVYIASFGSFEVIKAYTDRMFGTASPFNRATISTPSALEVYDADGRRVEYKDGTKVAEQKLPQLEKICTAAGLKKDEIIFFDGALSSPAQELLCDETPQRNAHDPLHFFLLLVCR